MMALDGYWRRCYVQMWRRGSFVKLSRLRPSGQGLWLYLLTCPESGTVPGTVVAGRAALAELLEWEQAEFDGCFAELEQQGMATADWKARLIFLPNAPAANLPQSVMVATGWGRAWKALPDCTLKEEVRETVVRVLAAEGPRGSADAFMRGCGLTSSEGEDLSDGGSEDDNGARIVKHLGEDPPPLGPDTICWLRCKGHIWTEVTRARLVSLQTRFPLVNVARELTRVGGMAYWLEHVKETDRKAHGRRSLWRFVDNWLARDQAKVEARGGKRQAAPAEVPAAPADSPFAQDHAAHHRESDWERYVEHARSCAHAHQPPMRYAEWKDKHGDAAG